MTNVSKNIRAICCAALLITVCAINESSKTTVKRSHLGVSFEDALNRQAACPPTCPRDCKDVQDLGYLTDGLYVVNLENDGDRPLMVFCDLEGAGGGWLVFQRRANGMVNFYRNWTEYENGFGQLTAEFWLGNYDLSLLLAPNKHYRLRVDLTNFNSTPASVYAEFTYFSIGSPSTKYRLGVYCGSYSGTAGDSLSYHSNMMYSTFDNDNDASTANRAVSYSGAWWYQSGHVSNLNGVYNNTYFRWNTWNASPLKTTEMKFRPM